MCRSSQRYLERKQQLGNELNSIEKDLITEPDTKDVFVEEFVLEEAEERVQDMEVHVNSGVEEKEEDMTSGSFEKVIKNEVSVDDFDTSEQNYSETLHELKRDIYTDANYDDNTCEYCFDKFDSLEQRKEHEKIHLSEERPYQCYVCSQSFRTRQTLRGHYESHMNLRWPCSYEGCETTFKTKHGKWVHEYKHRNERIPCPKCGKYLKTTWAVTQHIKRMHTELPFIHECIKCNKRFKTHKELYNHSIIHDENRRKHACDICQKKFFTKTKLVRHHEQVHSEKNVRIYFECSIKR